MGVICDDGVTSPVPSPSPTQHGSRNIVPAHIVPAHELGLIGSTYDKGITSPVPSPTRSPPVTTPGVLLSPDERDGSTDFAQYASSNCAQYSPSPLAQGGVSNYAPVTTLTTPGILLSPDEREGFSHHTNEADFTDFALDGASNYAQTSFFSPSSPQIR